MRTLVTGGAGFIGTHLVRRLLESGDDVVVLDSFEPQVHAEEPPSVPSGVTLFRGHVGDVELADQALVGIDRVAHLASAVGVGQSMYEIDRYVRRNTLDTATFLERLVACDPLPKRLVVASSMSIYGEGEYECPTHGPVAPGPRPETQLVAREWECLCPTCGQVLLPMGTRETKPLVPTSVYAITKRDHEELSLVVGGAYGIPSMALRFFNVYGPGQALSNPYTGVAAIFASRLLNRRAPIVFEDGLQSRDFIHVDDIVEGIVRALESDVSGIPVNLGTGRSVTVDEIATTLSRELGIDIEAERNDAYRAGDIRHCFADASRAEELLGFRARVTFEEGMGDLARWLADKEAVDHVESATQELFDRGLAR
jgi:dTDP-L-rhamnose 4-epimerase